MARKPRIVLANQPHHVVQRGNNRAAIYWRNDDYNFYLECLEDACEKHDCAVHAYVLMNNHVHLLLSPGKAEGLSLMMQSLGRRYVRYINNKYQRSGTLWEGRFNSSLIDSERYYFNCTRYIELNPVRAGLVKHPEAYPWSSYETNARGESSMLVKPHELYRQLGNDARTRAAAYRAMFAHTLDEKEIELIRVTAEKGMVLGNDSFRKTVAKKLRRSVDCYGHGGDRRSDQYRQI